MNWSHRSQSPNYSKICFSDSSVSVELVYSAQMARYIFNIYSCAEQKFYSQLSPKIYSVKESTPLDRNFKDAESSH